MIDVHKSDRNSEWYKPRGAAIELWESRRDPRSFSVVSWKHFHRYNCLQNGKVWKDPQTFCIVNMAMSDLLFPILQFPQIVIELFSDSRLIDSSLGQDRCKVVFSLPYFSLSILSEYDSNRAVVFPPHSSVWSCALPLLSPLGLHQLLRTLHICLDLKSFYDFAGRQTCGIHETESLNKYAV